MKRRNKKEDISRNIDMASNLMIYFFFLKIFCDFGKRGIRKGVMENYFPHQKHHFVDVFRVSQLMEKTDIMQKNNFSSDSTQNFIDTDFTIGKNSPY